MQPVKMMPQPVFEKKKNRVHGMYNLRQDDGRCTEIKPCIFFAFIIPFYIDSMLE